MPATWNGILSTGRSEPLSISGLAWPLELRPHPRARAMRLRLDEARERLVLTFPRRMSRRTVLDWALGQGEWVDRQLAHVQPGEPFVSGSTIPLEGRAIKLQWLESLPRNPGGGGRRRFEPLGQLFFGRFDPLQLAADPRAPPFALVGRRARSRPSPPHGSWPGV